MLPRELLVKIFSHLGTPRDVGACALTCRFFAAAASEPEIWHEMAVRKYGKHVAEATLHLYEGNWKSMLADDNKRGALPTRAIPASRGCYWLSKTNNRFYCCLLTGIQWDRRNGKVRLYLDAHGENDLRHPRKSSVAAVDTAIAYMQTFQAESWVADVEKSGHYKGCLIFDEARFQPSTTYKFCYGNLFHWSADKDTIPLFYWNHQQLRNYTLDVSLFANDTPKVERDRWVGSVLMEIVPGVVLERWWAE